MANGPQPTPTGPPGNPSYYAQAWQDGYNAGYQKSWQQGYKRAADKRTVGALPPPHPGKGTPEDLEYKQTIQEYKEAIAKRYSEAYKSGFDQGHKDADLDIGIENDKKPPGSQTT